MNSLQLSFVGAIASVVALNAHAAENGFYVGASKGETETRDKGGLGRIYDEQDQAFKILGGFRPVDWFAIEASYFDLGEVTLYQAVPDLSPFKLEQKGYDAFAVFLVPLPLVDLFAKVGGVRSSADLTTNTIAGPTSSVDQDTDVAWGAGAQFKFRKLAARIEYERLEISNGNRFKPPQVVSVGVTWTF